MFLLNLCFSFIIIFCVLLGFISFHFTVNENISLFILCSIHFFKMLFFRLSTHTVTKGKKVILFDGGCFCSRV